MILQVGLRYYEVADMNLLYNTITTVKTLKMSIKKKKKIIMMNISSVYNKEALTKHILTILRINLRDSYFDTSNSNWQTKLHQIQIQECETDRSKNKSNCEQAINSLMYMTLWYLYQSRTDTTHVSICSKTM